MSRIPWDDDVPPGLYRVEWKDGSTSFAAVGDDQAGGRWMAPCEYDGPGIEPGDGVKHMEAIVLLQDQARHG